MMHFYRALLRLYPAGFRAEYRDELCVTFAERMREHSGSLAPLLNALAAIGDVVPNAVAAHWDILRQDLRYAAGSLGRTPGFAITAVLIVALGVGANTAAFSLAHFVLLRPLPFPKPDRLVKLWQRTPGYGRVELSPANYRDWKAMAGSVEGMEAMIGIPPLAGRVFRPGDSSRPGRRPELPTVANPVRWDPRILGSVVRLDGAPFTVIGVMPASFRFPTREAEAWTPLLLREQDFLDRNDNYLQVIGRLRDGVSLEKASEELAVIAARLEQQYPKENKETGAAVCILLLACANLASLFLARATHRARELAVRAALGAGRERLVRQLVTESIGLALVGGFVGVAVAVIGVPLLARLVPDALPIAEQPSVNLPVLLVAAVLVVITGLVFGVGPALRAGRSKALDALRDGVRAGGGRTQRVRAGLVIVEVAASVVLLISSGLLLRAVMRIQAIDPGFRAESVLTLRTPLPSPEYDLTARREQFYGHVLQDVRALPGVRSAAYVTGLPMNMPGGIWPVSITGDEVLQSDASNSASLRFVTPQFFPTLGIPLHAGRDVAESDTRESPPVAVISESFAKRYWPNESPIGKRFTCAFNERTIVGVVGDVRVRGLERQSEPQVYLPSQQMADSSLISYPPKDLVVRSTSTAAGLLPTIRRVIHAADPEQPISNARMMTEIVADETASRVAQLRLLGTLSLIALLIAGVGIHGLLTFTVSQRSQELGIRRALGEQATSIVRRVLGEGMTLTLAGLGVGVLLAYLSARAMGALLAGVQPADPATITVAAVLCLTTAIVGCLRPAICAARTDPIVALRGE